MKGKKWIRNYIWPNTTKHSTSYAQNHQLTKYVQLLYSFNVYTDIYVTFEHSFASSVKPYVFGWQFYPLWNAKWFSTILSWCQFHKHLMASVHISFLFSSIIWSAHFHLNSNIYPPIIMPTIINLLKITN